MKQILGAIIVAGVLLTPAPLSSTEPIYRPTYPVCIMKIGNVEYLLLKPGGEVIKYEVCNQGRY